MENIRSNPFYDEELVKECLKKIMPNSSDLQEEAEEQIKNSVVDMYYITDIHIGKYF